MTAPELAAALDVLGWEPMTLARRAGWPWTLMQRMTAGTRAVDPALAAWARAEVRHRERHPPPAYSPAPVGRPRRPGGAE